MSLQGIILILATILCCNKIIHGANVKWHIIAGLLFYIEREQKYNPSEALQYCKSLGMDNSLVDDIAPEFYGYYINFYGVEPAIYEANSDGVYGGKRNYLIVRNNKVNTLPLTTDESSVEYGFICSANISKAYVKYRNGDEELFPKTYVVGVCNPQYEMYGQDYCLIVFD